MACASVRLFAACIAILLALCTYHTSETCAKESILCQAAREKTSRQSKILQFRAELYDGTLYVSGRVENEAFRNSMVFLGGDIQGVTFTSVGGYFFFKVPYYIPYGEVTARVANSDGEETMTAIIEFFE